jgi:hypothetical protein
MSCTPAHQLVIVSSQAECWSSRYVLAKSIRAYKTQVYYCGMERDILFVFGPTICPKLLLLRDLWLFMGTGLCHRSQRCNIHQPLWSCPNDMHSKYIERARWSQSWSGSGSCIRGGFQPHKWKGQCLIALVSQVEALHYNNVIYWPHHSLRSHMNNLHWYFACGMIVAFA